MSPQVERLEPFITAQPGEEQWEIYPSRVFPTNLIMYDYRHTNGEGFSCVDNTLEKCRERRDEWLAKLPQPTQA